MADFFLERHASHRWADLLTAVAALDVLAGLAAATAPSAAPAGCAFCRPTCFSGSEVDTGPDSIKSLPQPLPSCDSDLIYLSCTYRSSFPAARDARDMARRRLGSGTCCGHTGPLQP